jgi:hypothetical protein
VYILVLSKDSELTIVVPFIVIAPIWFQLVLIKLFLNLCMLNFPQAYTNTIVLISS